MTQYFRFILYMITGFFLFIFVYITFYSDQYRGHKNQIDYSGLGLYSITGDIAEPASVTEQKINSKEKFSESFDDAILLDKPGLLGSYYVSEKWIEWFKRVETATGQTISVSDGEYFFDFQWPSEEVLIESDDFSLDLIGKGRLYIKQTDRYLAFYSFDSIFQVNIKDIYTWKEASSFYVYPWMYAKWNKYTKELWLDDDAETFNELFYINNLQLTGKKQSKNSDSSILMYSFNFIYLPYETYVNNVVNRELKKVLWVTTNFLDLALLHDRERKKDFREDYEHLEWLLDYKWQLLVHLQKYLNVFFNDSKRVVYYKNVILYNLSEIVKSGNQQQKISKVKGTEQEKHVDAIWENLKILQWISEDEYQDTLLFIEDSYYFFNYIYPSDFASKQHLKDLYLWERTDDDFVWENNDYLSHVFHLYHSKGIEEIEFNAWIMKYVISSSRILDSEKSQSFYYYYYVYDKVLKNYVDKLGILKEGFDDVVRILENISFINSWYFISQEAKKGVLYINAEIIEHILSYLNNLYFEELRNSDKLLVLKDNGLNINDSTILNLEKKINFLLDFQKGAKILDEKNENDSALLQKYARLGNESEEYFEAIIDNDSYINAKALWVLERYASFAKEDEEKLTWAKLKEYLEWFNQVSLEKAKVNLIDDSYFEIQSVKVSGENMSFDLYPLEFNKINNIKKATEWKEYLADILLTNSEDDFKLDDPNILTIDEVYNYLLNLWYVEILRKDISIQKETYYSLRNVNVSWVKYDFSFFPRSWNSVISVMEGLGVAYKLDNLKPAEDARDIVQEEEDYNNFFIELLTKTKIAEKELVIISDEWAKESVEENIFKNDFLFGERWDFTKISDNVNLNYDNVEVSYNQGDYNTVIKSVPMLPKDRGIKNAKWENIQAQLTSEYVIAESRSYFKRMSLKFLLFKEDIEKGKYEFWNQKMEVLGIVDIEKFDDFYENVWDDYKKMSELDTIRLGVLWDIDVNSFKYSPSSRDASINYDYNNDVIIVSFREWEVIKIRYGSQIFEWEDLEDTQKVFRLFL